MSEKITIKEIKKLIAQGFDLELISFEFDVSLEDVQKIKALLEKENQKAKVEEEKVKVKRENYKINKTQIAHKKIEQMRYRYRRLFYSNNYTESTTPKNKIASDEEKALVDSILEKIEKRVNEMESLPFDERGIKVIDVLKTILKDSKIENFNFTIEQAEKLNKLLEFKGIVYAKLKYTNYYLIKSNKIAIRKLIDAIEEKSIDKINDIDELKRLRQKLTSNMSEYCAMEVESFKNKISHRISVLTQKEIMDKIVNNVPVKIQKIVTDLANGTIDIQEIERIIDEEAKRRFSIVGESKFSLTEEQQKRQVVIQIKKILTEKFDEYKIINPELTMNAIQKLYGENFESAIKTVNKNLIENKEFDRAREFCNHFTNGQIESLSGVINRQQMEINNAEIGDFILKGIKMEGTIEEEVAYFELIENGLRRGNINSSLINLGMSQDKKRKITLDDIWYEKRIVR